LQDEAERKRKLLETGIDTSPIVFETADIHDDLLDQMLAAYSEHNPPMDSNGGGIGPVDVSDQQHQSQYHHYDHYGGYTQRQPQNPYNTIAYNGNSWVMGLCANFRLITLGHNYLKLFLFVLLRVIVTTYKYSFSCHGQYK
jgi:hypothetical protein